MTWFNRQSRLLQVLLLLIPVVNWITELIVRWATFIHKPGLIRLVICIVYTIVGLIPILGWIDLIWVLLFKKLLFQ